jgi:hypothetical protein
MARYLETAAKANKVAQNLLELVPEAARPAAAAMMAQLVNLGIRCNPRPAMSTVRLNAVRRAIQGLPVKVKMETVPIQNPRPGGKTSFNALVVEAVGVEPVSEADGDDE